MNTTLEDSTAPGQTASATRPGQEDRSWDGFVHARTADEFCKAWLVLLCAQMVNARAAAILVENSDAGAYVPIAVWPEPVPDLSRLSDVVGQAINEKRSVVQADEGQQSASTFIAYPVFVEDKVVAIIALDMNGPVTHVQTALRQMHWGSAWLSNLFARRDWDEAIHGRERVSAVMESIAIALRPGKFQQVLFEVCNDLRHRLGCSRVAIGLVDQSVVRLAALSEAATFEKGSPLSRAYAAAMEEVLDHGAVVSCATTVTTAGMTLNEWPRHADLLEQSGASRVFSIPMLHGMDCIGVITLERTGDTVFNEADHIWMDAFATLFTSIAEQRRAAERSSIGRLAHEAKELQVRLFGPGHLLWKTAGSLMVLFVAIMVLLHVEYRVAAKTVIEGDIQRVAAAPFEGFIGSSHVRAGDTVRKGQILARLDDRDLIVEQARWASERDQYDNKLREAMANHDLTAVQVVGAQLRQAEAQLALVTEKINRASLVAPYDGVVVSGDLSQQIGTPVESGKKLFEIAPLQRYRVILQVDEREIRHVTIGQKGRLVISGIAGDPLPFTVAKVTSVATAQDGKNFFRVEAQLQHASERLRPGMEGVGKVEVGERQLWWIVTHSFTDWLRLALWRWSL